MMFNNVALDVFIGLVFVYLIYSLLATVLQEIIATRFSLRAKILEKAIIRMLQDNEALPKQVPFWSRVKSFFYLFGKKNLLVDKPIAAWFYAHPLIKYLGEDNRYSKPAYLSAQNFSKVLIDLLKGIGPSTISDVQRINDSIKKGTIYELPISMDRGDRNPAIAALEKLKRPNVVSNKSAVVTPAAYPLNNDTKVYLQSLWANSNADVNTFQSGLEQWYNDTMDRATGWYKRYIQYILFFVGLIIAVLFNADTISIYKILSKDKPARDQLVQMAIKNKDQLAATVKSLSKADSLRYEATSDEVYNKTYQVVASDAESATSVLGGRPWSDSTCAGCKELENKIRARVGVDSAAIVQSKKEIDTNSAKLIQLRLNKKSDTGQVKAHVTLLKKQSDDNIKDQINAETELHSLKVRCAYIKAQRDGNPFKYGPYQGAWYIIWLGWILTAFAISLGAPFWFDLLNKAMQLRGGSKIDSSPAPSSGKTTPAAPIMPSAPITNPVTNIQQAGGGAVG